MSASIGFVPDPELRAAFEQYRAAVGMTTSQAARVLLALALKQERDQDTTFREASFREGVTAGVAAVRKRLGDVLAGAMGDLETHLNGR